MFYSSLYFVLLVTASETNVLEEPTTQELVEIVQTTQEPDNIQEEKIQSVTITNAIEEEMLKYKHWTGTYSPDTFAVYINEKEVKTGDAYIASPSKEPIRISFSYSFMNGMRKGTKAYTYQINEDCSQITLTFSWLDKHKILMDNATFLTEETV